MLKRINYLVLISVIAVIASAEAVSRSLTTYDYEKEVLGEIPKQINDHVSGREEACSDCGHATKETMPSCVRITDDFCRALWSKENFGNMQLRDGKVVKGYSAEGDNSLVWLQALKDIVSSRDRLPSDLRLKTEGIIDELSDLLKQETFSRDWNRKASRAVRAFNDAIDSTVNERVEVPRPDLKTKSTHTLAESNLYKFERNKLLGQVLDAKFRNDPRWTRVESLYKTVAGDLEQVIKEMNISDAEKKVRIDKLYSVKLTLPYADERAGADEDCATTKINAYYSAGKNIFTVCAGYLNALQSTSALYFVIAHELAHSFDSNIIAWDRARNSELSKVLKPLIGMKSSEPAIACDQWTKILADLKDPSSDEINVDANVFADHRDGKSSDALQPFYDCLEPKKNLKEISPETLKAIGLSNATDDASVLASGDFLYLIAPTKPVRGVAQPNEYYNRPDLFITGGRPKERHFAEPAEIFMQSYSCLSSVSDKDERLRATFKQVKLVSQAKAYDRLNFCKTNCSGLTGRNLSKDSGEKVADWMAQQALRHHLKRLKNLSEKRESSAAATALFCSEPNIFTENAHLAQVAREFSLLVHPEDKIRRLGIYNAENAELLQCKPEEKSGFEACKP